MAQYATERSGEDRRHCMDHTGHEEKIDALAISQSIMNGKIDDNFSTLKWMLGGMLVCFIGFGGYIFGVSSTMGKEIAVNSSRLITQERFVDKATRDIGDLQSVVWSQRVSK